MLPRTDLKIPDDGRLESSLSMLRQGYRFVPRRAQELRSRVFSTRVMLRPAICMTGADSARLFYDESFVQRAHAAPGALKRSLFGMGGVQGLDDEEHRHRKAMLMSLMTPEEIDRLARLSGEQWERAVERWSSGGQFVLLDEAHEMLTRAVCEWTGVPLPESEVSERTAQLTAMFEGAARPIREHLRARWAHGQAVRWGRDLVRDVRTRERPGDGPPGALRVVAWHRDLSGELLDESVAAVELLNVLRPTVAVARWYVFLAVAMHTHAGARERLASGEWRYEWFMEEVRRFYPFFPIIAGRSRREFEWGGRRFPGGRLLLLDLFGTNRDPERWEEPDRFRPERFRDREIGAFEFVPQGGGDIYEGHRCAGEWATQALMKTALEFLVHRLEYDVPPQDLRIPMAKIPSVPESGFVITHVRRR